MNDDFEVASAPPCRISGRRLTGLQSDLFVQAECHRVEAATSLVHTNGVGIVYAINPLRRKRMKADAGAVIDRTRRRAPSADVLIDASWYTGKNRKLASSAPTRDWITCQRGHGLSWAMTDSGYCGAGDLDGLVTTLSAGAGFGPGVIVALPLSHRWLTEDADTLKTQIDRFGVPVALMLEDESDPLDRSGAVSGLVEVLATDTPVMLLRSDVAALGALAYGAAGGAVGTTSTYRHIYPRSDRDGGGPVRLSFVIPQLLGYFLNSRFENAYRIDATLPAWKCGCLYCAGLDLTWIASSQDPFEAAFQHSVAALAALGRNLTASIAAGVSAPSAWTQMCLAAQMEHFTVERATGGEWKPKDSLAEWIRITPTNVGV